MISPARWVEGWDTHGYETKRGDFGPDARIPIRSRIASVLARWVGYR